jgi:hypothetical protein
MKERDVKMDKSLEAWKNGKRKERCQKAINLVKDLMKDSEDGNLNKALIALEGHKRKLERA